VKEKNKNLIGIIILSLSFWNLINSLITIFVYIPRLRRDGFSLLTGYFDFKENINIDNLLKPIINVTYIYSLILIILFMVNIYIILKNRKKTIEDKYSSNETKWYVFVLILSILTMDILSISFSIIIIVLIKSKTKAINEMTTK